jgi:hypothetical protein
MPPPHQCVAAAVAVPQQGFTRHCHPPIVYANKTNGLWDEEKWCATKKGKKKEKIDRKRKSSTSNDGGDGKCKKAM